MRTRYGFVVAGGGGGGGGGEEIIRFATRRDRALPGNNGPHSMFDPMRLSRRRGKNERGGGGGYRDDTQVHRAHPRPPDRDKDDTWETRERERKRERKRGKEWERSTVKLYQ